MTNDKMMKKEPEKLLIGIDVGSTTTKIAAVDPENGTLLYSDYRRHHADQVQSIICALEALKEKYPDTLLSPLQ